MFFDSEESVLKKAREIKLKHNEKKKLALQKYAEELKQNPPEFPKGKYSIIYADPPWCYDDKASSTGGAENHYPTMNLEELKKLAVDSISNDDCILFLWVTMPQLNICFELIESWGFAYKTCAFVWIKKNKSMDSFFWGMGNWTRANAELCLLATKGNPKRINASVHSIIEAPVEHHSKKPDIIRDKIVELCGNLPKVELFARQNTVGWNTFG